MFIYKFMNSHAKDIPTKGNACAFNLFGPNYLHDRKYYDIKKKFSIKT